MSMFDLTGKVAVVTGGAGIIGNRVCRGLAANGALSEAAMARTIKALRVCAAKIRRGRVSRARSVATEACRRAATCETFLARARSEAGLELDSASDERLERLPAQRAFWFGWYAQFPDT